MQVKVLALKSLFMNEICDLRQEISPVRSQVEQERLHHSKNKDCAGEEENINEELKAKLHSCHKEIQLLKEEIKSKQKTIETILNQNNELLKFSHYFDQNRMEKNNGGNKFKEHKEKGNGSEGDGNQEEIKYQESCRTVYQTVAN